MNTRSPRDGPWCWQSKAARRRIRDAFDATHNVASALSVYDALTEIASDHASEAFETTHAWIARISGTSPRTVQKVLKVLSELGLVFVETPKLRAPSRYVLLAFGDNCASIGNGRFTELLPPSEETPERKRKETTFISVKNLPHEGPDGWQSWVDSHLPDSDHATGKRQFGPWQRKDSATRAFIERGMAEKAVRGAA